MKWKNKMKVNKRNIVLLCAVVLTAAFMIVAAKAEPNQPENDQSVLLDQSDSGVEIGDSGELADSGEFFSDQTVQSINFKKDMSIRDALRFLGAKYKKNIIPSANIIGKLNVTSLYEVTFEQALDAILGPGYHYEADGNFIRVYTTEEYARYSQDATRMTSRVYTLYYINAAEAKTLITPILSATGKISSTSAAAVDTEAGKGGNTNAMRDTIVVFDIPDRLDKIGQMIKEIDVRPQQIMIEVTVLKAQLSETTQFGIEWDKIAGIGAVSRTTTPLDMSISLASTATTGLTMGYTNNAIVASITALEGITDTTVLANPKIMAMNKQAGYINIGGQKGYTESTTQNTVGTTAQVKLLDYGTTLEFRPFICEDGYIRMEINPKESIATTAETTSGAVIPSTTKTEVKTNIMVKDGRTIIIGGLFKEELTNTDSQVPIVGDLPIIGWLFKSTKDENIRTELVILITPHIINRPEDLIPESEEKQQDIDRIVHGSRKRMNPIAREKIYEDGYARAVEYYTDKEYEKALKELDWIIGFRPNALEAVKLKEKILTETNPAKLQASERVMLDETDKKLDGMWKRK